MIDSDATFSDVSAYGSTKWACARIGKSYDWFIRNQDKLFSLGFPTKDPVIGQWLKADVDAWIENRRVIRDTDGIGTNTGANLNGL